MFQFVLDALHPKRLLTPEWLQQIPMESVLTDIECPLLDELVELSPAFAEGFGRLHAQLLRVIEVQCKFYAVAAGADPQHTPTMHGWLDGNQELKITPLMPNTPLHTPQLLGLVQSEAPQAVFTLAHQNTPQGLKVQADIVLPSLHIHWDVNFQFAPGADRMQALLSGEGATVEETLNQAVRSPGHSNNPLHNLLQVVPLDTAALMPTPMTQEPAEGDGASGSAAE